MSPRPCCPHWTHAFRRPSPSSHEPVLLALNKQHDHHQTIMAPKGKQEHFNRVDDTEKTRPTALTPKLNPAHSCGKIQQVWKRGAPPARHQDRPANKPQRGNDFNPSIHTDGSNNSAVIDLLHQNVQLNITAGRAKWWKREQAAQVWGSSQHANKRQQPQTGSKGEKVLTEAWRWFGAGFTGGLSWKHLLAPVGPEACKHFGFPQWGLKRSPTAHVLLQNTFFFFFFFFFFIGRQHFIEDGPLNQHMLSTPGSRFWSSSSPRHNEPSAEHRSCDCSSVAVTPTAQQQEPKWEMDWKQKNREAPSHYDIVLP